MGVRHRERVGGRVHHLQVVEKVPEDHRLVGGHSEPFLHLADRLALVRGGAQDVDPVDPGHHDLVTPGEVGQPGRRVVLGRGEVVDRDLQDVVVGDLQQVVDDLQPRVVGRDVLDEPPLSPLDVGGALAAEHGPGLGDAPHPAHHLLRDIEPEAVRGDLPALSDDVRAVLGDEDQLVGDVLELLQQVVVLAAAGRAEGDAPGVQLVDERPELVVDLLRVVHERAVHVRGDEPDVGTGAQAGQLRQVVRVRVGQVPPTSGPLRRPRARPSRTPRRPSCCRCRSGRSGAEARPRGR